MINLHVHICENALLSRRDYTVMDEVVDRELWERCRKGRMTSRRVEPAPMKREVKEEGGGYQEWKRRRREGERDSRNNSGRRERDAREDEGRRERNGRSWRNEEYSWREERPGGDRRREGNLRSTPPTEFKRETDRGGYRERKEVEERLLSKHLLQLGRDKATLRASRVEVEKRVSLCHQVQGERSGG